jgi:Flp pilus assembly protein TadG
MNEFIRSKMKGREKGQSVVEVVLFLPIFVILLAGLVEVSQLVVSQNRVTNAARVGARFGANGGEDKGIVETALNSITQTLCQDESQWDIWTVRAVVDQQGTGYDKWSFTHVYGISNTKRFAEVDESQVKADVLMELQSQGTSATAGIELVAAYLMYDVDSILGLNALPLVAGINSVQELSVMRVYGFHNDADGCDAFPIAVSDRIRSVNPPGSATDPFPDAKDFGNGNPLPLPEYDDFSEHVPNIPLQDAKEGYIYLIKNGFGAGNFGWLRWNQGRPNDANTLNESLTFPGNSLDYGEVNGGQGVNCPEQKYPFCPASGRVNGYVNVDDESDTGLGIGDWVAANTGNVNSSAVRSTLMDHIIKGKADPPATRTLRVIIWDDSRLQGNFGAYHIAGFAIFKLHGYNLSGNPSWILAEFVRKDTSCGQESG